MVASFGVCYRNNRSIKDQPLYLKLERICSQMLVTPVHDINFIKQVLDDSLIN